MTVHPKKEEPQKDVVAVVVVVVVVALLPKKKGGGRREIISSMTIGSWWWRWWRPPRQCHLSAARGTRSSAWHRPFRLGWRFIDFALRANDVRIVFDSFFFGRPGVPNPPEIREASHHFQHLAVSIDSLPSQGVGVGPKYANENAHQYANEETPRACLLGLSFLPWKRSFAKKKNRFLFASTVRQHSLETTSISFENKIQRNRCKNGSMNNEMMRKSRKNRYSGFNLNVIELQIDSNHGKPSQL